MSSDRHKSSRFWCAPQDRARTKAGFRISAEVRSVQHRDDLEAIFDVEVLVIVVDCDDIPWILQGSFDRRFERLHHFARQHRALPDTPRASLDQTRLDNDRRTRGAWVHPLMAPKLFSVAPSCHTRTSSARRKSATERNQCFKSYGTTLPTMRTMFTSCSQTQEVRNDMNQRQPKLESNVGISSCCQARKNKRTTATGASTRAENKQMKDVGTNSTHKRYTVFVS